MYVYQVLSETPNTGKTRVAIIGAGASGLIAARHILSRPERFAVTVFERTDAVGGTWVYTNETTIDQYGLPVHSSAYKNLRYCQNAFCVTHSI